MKDLKPTCRIAVVQAAPVLFDKAACTDKAVRLIAECAHNGAELIVKPEQVRRVLQLIETIFESAKTGHSVACRI